MATSTALAQTAGGRAAALLSLTLVELYEESEAGSILFHLSSKILRGDQNNASMIQLEQVATTVSNKLKTLAFGNHLGTHVTRIREAYLNSGRDIPRNPLSLETLTEFLAALHTALYEESSVLYVEGCRGIGVIVALVVALCPNDTVINVENESLFQGERRSIIISIKSEFKTHFGLETVLIDTNVRSKRPFFVMNLEPSKLVRLSLAST